MLNLQYSARFQKLAVELGCGDGKMLHWLASANSDTFFIGIEINHEEYLRARLRKVPSNAVLIEASCEEIVGSLDDLSLDFVLAVFPDPALVDSKKEKEWRPFYQKLFKKLKSHGRFRLITELTDDLLQPVYQAEFEKWVEWLKSAFSLIGFSVQNWFEGAPPEYSSRCLDQFRADPLRIRIVTFDFFKP